MRILFLHGLDSSPNLEKIGLLEDLGHELFSPNMHYRDFFNDISLFERTMKLVEDESIEHIVGSSFGGYFGFYLSELFKINATLFNPALMQQSFIVPVKESKTDTKKNLLVGKYDSVIAPEGTYRFIKDNGLTNSKIIELEIGHQVPLDAFQFGISLIC